METAGVGTAIALIVTGTALIQIVGNGFVYLYCHFRSSDPSRAQDVLRQVLQVTAVGAVTIAAGILEAADWYLNTRRANQDVL